MNNSILQIPVNIRITDKHIFKFIIVSQQHKRQSTTMHYRYNTHRLISPTRFHLQNTSDDPDDITNLTYR